MQPYSPAPLATDSVSARLVVTAGPTLHLKSESGEGEGRNVEVEQKCQVSACGLGTNKSRIAIGRQGAPG